MDMGLSTRPPGIKPKGRHPENALSSAFARTGGDPLADAQRADQSRGHHPHIMSLLPCPPRDPEGFRARLQNDAPWRSFP